MTDVIAVRFRNNPKQLWFDPNGSTPQEGDHVIVQTDRGTEIGLACSDVFEADAAAIKALPSALKPVLRVATEADLDKADELARKGEEALPRFRELIEKHKLDMKPVRVDFIFGGEKVVFYFASEDRVDFRDLVRDLASTFHARVDMRQIGVRDEARMVGGLAHCGQELCCARLGGEFQPVSIRMAKEQDLPLNPLKISGLCGRLMCCLRYEFEAYKDFKGRAPKHGATIETPLGLAKVVEFDTPREIIAMRLEDGKMLHIPLSGMECDKQADGSCTRPCRVTAEAIEEIAETDRDMSSTLGTLDRSLEDGVVSDGTVTSNPRRPRRRSSGAEGSPRGGQRPAGQGQHSKPASGEGEEAASRPRRRRRRGKGGAAASGAEGSAQGQGQQRQGAPRANGNGNGGGNGGGGQRQQRAGGNQAPRRSGGPRPGQNSSGVRNGGQHAAGEQSTSARPAGDQPRRQPRRRHPSSEQGGAPKGGQGGAPKGGQGGAPKGGQGGEAR